MKNLNKSFVGFILVLLLIFTSIPIVQAEDTSYFDKMPTYLRRLMEDSPADALIGVGYYGYPMLDDNLHLYFSATDAETEFEKMGLDLNCIEREGEEKFRVRLTADEIILLAKDERTIKFTYSMLYDTIPYVTQDLSPLKISPQLQTILDDVRDYEILGEEWRWDRLCLYVTPTDPQMTQQEVEDFYKSYTAELGIDWNNVKFCTSYGCIGVALTKPEILRLAEDDRVLNFHYNIDFQEETAINYFEWNYTASDALAILQAAVGKGCYNFGPLFDNNRDGFVNSTDALRALQDSVETISVGWSRNEYRFPDID